MRSSHDILLVCLVPLVLAGCSLAFHYDETAGDESTDEACADGLDNDRDGRLDCRDTDCVDAAPCREATDDACDDGRDNDLDGRVDCDDDDCASAAPCGEDSLEACSNGLDDDSDGLIDCADDSCDGFCPEDDTASCTDGRDNDDDGLPDGADPRCWPLFPPTANSCPSVVGPSFDEPLESADEIDAFYVAGTSPTTVHYPLVGDALLLAAGTTLGTRRSFAGSWDGFVLEALIGPGFAHIILAPATTTPVGTPARGTRPFAELLVDSDGAELTVGRATQRVEIPDRDGWYLLRMTTELVGGVDGTWVLGAALEPLPTLGSGSAATVPSIFVADSEFPGFPESRLLLVGPGQVSRLRFDLGTHQPCGVNPPIPDNEADIADGLLFDAGLDVAVANSTDLVCVLTVECSTAGTLIGAGPITNSIARSYVVTDGPYRRSEEFVGGARVAGLAWDPTGERFVAALTDDGEVRLYQSTDCQSWSVLAEPEPPMPYLGDRYRAAPVVCSDPAALSPTDTLSYVVRTVDGEPRHELYWVVGESGAGELARVISTDGGLSFEPPELLDIGRPVGRMARVTSVGRDDLVLTQIADPFDAVDGVLMGVLDAGEYLPIGSGPILQPSRIPGTFDRDTILSAMLLPSELGGAVLYYGAVGDYLTTPPGRVRMSRAGLASLTLSRARL